MESTTYAVRDTRPGQKNPDGRDQLPDGLLPVPSSIKDQMPQLAAMLQDLSAQLGREAVQLQLKASMDLRKAFDADDYRAVSAVYRRGDGWIDWQEAGFCVGVPKQAMQTFAQRHRSA